jgi:large subunit ribosomal protein L18
VSLQKRVQKKIKLRTKRRTCRVRNKQTSREQKPRICVFRSLKHIHAQIIDDAAQKVLVGFSSLNVKNKKSLDKIGIAKKVGLELGKVAVEKSIKEAFFDRGKYLYHGRVQAFVEGLRESGLKL